MTDKTEMGTPRHLKTAAISPAAEAVLVHCRRTAAVAKLISHHLFLSSEQKDLLSAACLLHHSFLGIFAPRSMERILADVLGDGEHRLVMDDPIPVTVREILNAFSIPGSGTPIESRLASILRLADTFDQDMEARPIDCAPVGEILERLRSGVEGGLWPAELIDALVEATLPPMIGDVESWRVPVFPQAALRTLRLMRDPRVSLADVVEAASMDPATAGLVMRLANSALFGSGTPVSTLSKAIGRLGFATSQRVITSAALHPLFTSARLQETWRHSLDVADIAEQLACQVGTVDPGVAYLAGLIHDVGRIALPASLYDAARLQGLAHGGCPAVYAESLILRTDHAALSARIAAGWRLSETLVSAIGQHHCLENAEDPLACLLYLAEYLSGSEEDLPSIVRLESALNGLGLAWNDVCDCRPSALGSWLAAA